MDDYPTKFSKENQQQNASAIQQSVFGLRKNEKQLFTDLQSTQVARKINCYVFKYLDINFHQPVLSFYKFGYNLSLDIKIYSMNRNILLICLLIFTASAVRVAHEGSYAWYTYDEALTDNLCVWDDQCDGQRTCSRSGFCQGTSRPEKNERYLYNENNTGKKCPTSSSDPNYANRDYYCDGNRTCSNWGWCQGTAR